MVCAALLLLYMKSLLDGHEVYSRAHSWACSCPWLPGCLTQVLSLLAVRLVTSKPSPKDMLDKLLATGLVNEPMSIHAHLTCPPHMPTSHAHLTCPPHNMHVGNSQEQQQSMSRVDTKSLVYSSLAVLAGVVLPKCWHNVAALLSSTMPAP